MATRTMVGLNYTAGSIQLVLFVFLCVWLGRELVQGNFETGDMFPIPVYGIVTMLAAFTLITGLMHIIGYAQANAGYQEKVGKGLNWKRWLEYTMTATIMLLVIAMSSGIQSGSTLALIAVCSSTCMILGYISEQTAIHNATVSKWATGCGWLLLLMAYGVILYRFQEVTNKRKPPGFVYGIVWSMFGLFMSFGVIHLVHMSKQWSHNKPTERFNRRIDGAYTVASAGAKITLVVLLASGLFARTQIVDESTESTA